MLGAAQVITRRAVRATRRVAGAALRRLGLLQVSNTPHKPVFASRLLFARLGVELGAGDFDGLIHESERIAHAGARRARSLFGPRFFAQPEQIAGLSERLKQVLPSAVRELMDRVRADVHEGLPVYGSCGNKLGVNFCWASPLRNPVDDVMYAKRPHRFAFAPRHAWACLDGPASAERLRGMLEAWMQHAATGRDRLCYDSNLAVIQRLLALSWAWVFLAARPEQEGMDGLGLEWRVLQIIEADVRFLEPLLGQSAPNNHLLADRFAGWYLSTVFPELLDEVPANAEELWCEELLAQTYPDGGNFEHSSHYHEFSCEMSAAYLILKARNAGTPDLRVRERTRALLAYQCALTGPEATVVAIGNAIEDTLFPLDASEAWCPGSLREIYRTLFDMKHVPAGAKEHSVIRAFWLLAGELRPAADNEVRTSTPAIFERAGLGVLVDTRRNARLLLRTGPAPDSVVAAGHTHADLLAVYLNLHGRPMLVDAGTYTYRWREVADSAQRPNWRRYFAGPAAHNGFTRAGEDPLGALTDDFRPRHTETRVSMRHASNSSLSLIEGQIRSSGGYDGVRRACAHIYGEYWLLLDLMPRDETSAPASWFGFQFAPDIDVAVNATTAHAQFADDGAECWITHSDRVYAPDLLHGSLEPLGGWVSPRYGERLAAPQLRYAIHSAARASAFLIGVDRRFSDMRFVQNQERDDGAQCVQMRAKDVDDWLVYQPESGQVWEAAGTPLEFDGRLLWMRFEAGRLVSLRWLGGTALHWPGQEITLRAKHHTVVDVAIDRNTPVTAMGEMFEEWQLPPIHANH